MSDATKEPAVFAVVINMPKGFANHREARAWLERAIAEIDSHHPLAEEPAPSGSSWWLNALAAVVLVGMLLLFMNMGHHR